jgi:hypothetical protein
MTSKASSGSPPWFSGWASASMMCRNSTIEPGQPWVTTSGIGRGAPSTSVPGSRMKCRRCAPISTR